MILAHVSFENVARCDYTSGTHSTSNQSCLPSFFTSIQHTRMCTCDRYRQRYIRFSSSSHIIIDVKVRIVRLRCVNARMNARSNTLDKVGIVRLRCVNASMNARSNLFDNISIERLRCVDARMNVRMHTLHK